MNDRPDGPHKLKNPCIVDFDTTAGFMSLMMDKEYPHYLFVFIENELRKCVELSRKPAFPLKSDQDVFDFLESLRHSPLIQTIIDQEAAMNDSWKDL